MFDIFGLKAKRRVAQLESVIAEQSKKYADALRVAGSCEARIAGLNGQIIAVRTLANEMRDRVRTHGKTEGEAEFIRACLDIHSKGKKVSEHRFNYSMTLIRKEHESMTDWQGK